MKELDEIMASCREDRHAPTYADLLVVHGAVAELEAELQRTVRADDAKVEYILWLQLEMRAWDLRYSALLGVIANGRALLPSPGLVVHRPTLTQLAQAFELWEQDFRVSPSQYLTAEETAAGVVSELSASRAAHLQALLGEVLL